MNKLKEIKEEFGNTGVTEFLNEQGLTSEDLDFSLGNTWVSDHTTTLWKPKSRFIKVFQLELNRLVKNKDINLELLGFIKLLEKYIGYEDNILYNDEDDYLSQKDIMELTGLGRKKVIEMINTLTENKILFKFPHEKDKRKNIYYFNPNIAFKGSKIDKETKKFIDDSVN